MRQTLYTIGHSNHPVERFVQLLSEHQIAAVGDVRSKPYSRLHPQFNRETVKMALSAAGVRYDFLGHELGARTDDRNCYENGRVQYDRLAETALFQGGLARLLDRAQTDRIALMCAEKDPITCHRMILICRQLRRFPIQIAHIGRDGALESNADAEKRLIKALDLPECDLFTSGDETIEEAYREQAKRIAWVDAADERQEDIGADSRMKSSA